MNQGIKTLTLFRDMAKRPWLAIPGLLLALGGCFTEVGNAEDEQFVKADFRIDYSLTAQPLTKVARFLFQPESVFIHRFYLIVREAEYHNSDGSEKYLWSEDSLGKSVDFTQLDTAAMLPPQKIDLGDIVNFKLELNIPKHGKLRSDTLDLLAFNDRSYLTGIYRHGEQEKAFLFALPAGVLHLIYSKEAMAMWLKGNEYLCQITFFGGQWLAGARLDTAVEVRDKLKRPFVLLDSNSNSALYQRLADRFYQSFNTRNVYLRVGNEND